MMFIGIDDTDTLESRGTGHLARLIATAMSENFNVHGVTRHQLLLDPRVPYTKRNSSAAILLDDAQAEPAQIAEVVQDIILANLNVGSDPGFCVAKDVPKVVEEFGRKAKAHLVEKREAHDLAAAQGLILREVAGDGGGVIGALAAVGLAAMGEDGRYVQIGRIREMSGLLPVEVLLQSGLSHIQSTDGEPVLDGLVEATKLRPARRGRKPVVFVEWSGEHWLPIKID
jgi:tRNA(Ile2) C34 agmatinyltransferase TiaS